MSFRSLLLEADRLYEMASQLTVEQFETHALRRLGQIVGFNGMVWGQGRVVGAPSVVVIDHASLVDRPMELVTGYASIAAEDPIAEAFLKAPGFPVVDSVVRPGRYCLPQLERDLLIQHDIGHLAVCGRPADGTTLQWVTVYRGVRDRAYSEKDVRLLWSLVPLWNQAWEICRHRNGLVTSLSALGVRTAGASSGLASGGLDVPAGVLTVRQQVILQELSQGLKYAEIALRLNLSIDTVRSHIREIYGKLGVRNRTEAILASRAAMLPPRRI
jgi:DNA-binding CsgD family transcriptional regulator